MVVKRCHDISFCYRKPSDTQRCCNLISHADVSWIIEIASAEILLNLRHRVICQLSLHNIFSYLYINSTIVRVLHRFWVQSKIRLELFISN